MCKLTPKRQRFVNEYLIDLNATAAYVRAGYKAKDADVAGPRLLGIVGVQEAIAKAQAKLAAKLEITQEKVLTEYAKIAFSNMSKFSKWGPDGVTLIDSEDLDEDSAACVAEVSQSVTAEGGTIKFKLHDKKGALDSICKMLGFNAAEKKEHSGPGGKPIEINGLNAKQELASRIDSLIARLKEAGVAGESD